MRTVLAEVVETLHSCMYMKGLEEGCIDSSLYNNAVSVTVLICIECYKRLLTLSQVRCFKEEVALPVSEGLYRNWS